MALHIDVAEINGDYFKRFPKQDGNLNYITREIGFAALFIELREVTPDNIDEWLYRLGVSYELYGLPKINGVEREMTREELTGHIGLTVNVSLMTREQFDEKAADIRFEKEHGHPPRRYVHIRITTPLPGEPCDIYQEFDKRSGRERRRVEMYLDGRRHWVEDDYDGTGRAGWEGAEEEFPGLTILNDRHGQRAEFIDMADFNRLWEQATNQACTWVTDEDEGDECGQERETESDPWCHTHMEAARAMFPRLYEALV